MARKFTELREGMPVDAQQRSQQRAQRMLAEMRLQELRKTRAMTQTELASRLLVEQAAISRIESRDDLHLSTLRDYVQALGGELKLVASFPEGDVLIRQGEGGPGK